MGQALPLRDEALAGDAPRPENSDSGMKKRKLNEVNGSLKHDDSQEKKLSKEERRQAKRLRKLEGSTDQDSANVVAAEQTVDNGDIVDLDAKILRKQEKARLRAAKLAAKDKSQRPSQLGEASPVAESTGVNHDAPESGAAAGAAPKADKKRSKAEKKAKKEILTSKDATTNGDGETKTKPARSTSSGKGYVEDTALTALSQADVDAFLATNAIAINDPSTSSILRPITTFSYLSDIDLSPFAAFKAPTPIQSAAWPFLLSGRDMVGVAETGSGKTLAFGLPLIRHITSSGKPQKSNKSPTTAVIVSPTRELAVQIHTQIESLATPAALSSVCVYGGVPKDQQRDALRTAHIVVATPGRLNDLIEEGSADLSGVEYLVLDEADRMLDKGFEDAIRAIISTTSAKGRQTLMFTATWPPSVRELASTFMRQPVHISIGANNPTGELRANKSITQHVEVLDPFNKQTRLLQLLKQHASKTSDRILIFTLYKKEAARIEDLIRRNGYGVAAIHGDMSQPARSASLDGFKAGHCPLLVATDVAARGLDIPSVKLVINVTFPLTVEDYVHRIGRTGRAGKSGLAITFFTEQDKALSGGLINVLKAAGQEVPEELLRFGSTVKKKGHEAYGAFYKDVGGEAKTAVKIKF